MSVIKPVTSSQVSKDRAPDGRDANPSKIPAERVKESLQQESSGVPLVYLPEVVVAEEALRESFHHDAVHEDPRSHSQPQPGPGFAPAQLKSEFSGSEIRTSSLEATPAEKALAKTTQDVPEKLVLDPHKDKAKLRAAKKAEARKAGLAATGVAAKEPGPEQHKIGRSVALGSAVAKTGSGLVAMPHLIENAKERGSSNPTFEASVELSVGQTVVGQPIANVVNEARSVGMEVPDLLRSKFKEMTVLEFANWLRQDMGKKFAGGVAYTYVVSKAQPQALKVLQTLGEKWRPEKIVQKQKQVNELEKMAKNQDISAEVREKFQRKYHQAKRDLAQMKKDEEAFFTYLSEGFAGSLGGCAAYLSSSFVETLLKAIAANPELKKMTIQQILDRAFKTGPQALLNRQAAGEVLATALRAVPAGLAWQFFGGFIAAVLITAVVRNGDDITARIDQVGAKADLAKAMDMVYGDMELAIMGSGLKGVNLTEVCKAAKEAALAVGERLPPAEDLALGIQGVQESIHTLTEAGRKVAHAVKEKAEELAERAPEMPSADMSHFDSSGVPMTADDDISEEMHAVAQRGKEKAQEFAQGVAESGHALVEIGRGIVREVPIAMQSGVDRAKKEAEYLADRLPPVPALSHEHIDGQVPLVAREKEAERPRSVGFFGSLGSAARSVGSAIGSIIPFGKKAAEPKKEERSAERTSPQMQEHVDVSVAKPDREKEHTPRKATTEPERAIPALSIEHIDGQVPFVERPARVEGRDYDTVRLFGLIPIKVSKEPLPAQQSSASGSGFSQPQGSSTSAQASHTPSQASQTPVHVNPSPAPSHAHASALQDNLGGVFITS